MAPVASLVTHRTRERERLAAAVDTIWHRDDGAHRDDLRRILRNVDAGLMTAREAHRLVAQADTASQRAA